LSRRIVERTTSPIPRGLMISIFFICDGSNFILKTIEHG